MTRGFEQFQSIRDDDIFDPFSTGQQFTVPANQAYFTRFSAAKVNASEFSVKFAVQTESGAHIAFCAHTAVALHRDPSCYEVVIGGLHNSQSSIRIGNQGTPLVAQTTRHFNSNGTFRPFWIDLQGGTLRVGRGTISGTREFMSARVSPLGDERELFVGFAGYDFPVTFFYGPGVLPELAPATQAEQIAFTTATSVKPRMFNFCGGYFTVNFSNTRYQFSRFCCCCVQQVLSLI